MDMDGGNKTQRLYRCRSIQKPRIYRVYTLIKFANNAKSNHIKVPLLI